MATDRLKDAVSTSLILTDDGQNICFLPEWMEESHLTEATAERRGAKGWEKRAGMVRNETLDQLVQARALHILKKGEKIDPASAPPWARLGPENENAVQLEALKDAGSTETETDTSRATVATERPKRRRRRNSSMLRGN